MKTMKKMIMLMCVVLLALPVQAAFIPHNADTNGDGVIDLDELLRLIQFYNSAGMHCDDTTEDGYAPGWVCATLAECPPLCQSHDLDYIEVDWKIDLDELLRAIQFYNSLAYYRCTGSEDGFCAGEEPGETVVVGFDWTGWPLGDGGSVEECALEDPQGADCGLRSQGLVPDIRYQYSDVVPVGVVLTQNPAVGATVLVDSEVVLVVSAGPAPIIPDLSGLSPADAEEVLAEMGVWTCEPILTEYSHTVALGLVTRSNPPTGGKPSAYSVCVTLWESLGPEPEGEGEGTAEGEGSVEGEGEFGVLSVSTLSLRTAERTFPAYTNIPVRVTITGGVPPYQVIARQLGGLPAGNFPVQAPGAVDFVIYVTTAATGSLDLRVTDSAGTSVRAYSEEITVTP